MRTTLNLLSAADKERYRSRKLTLLVTKTAGVIFTAVVVVTIAAKLAEVTLERTWNKIQETNYAGSAEFNAKIKSINTLAAFVNTLALSHHDWSAVLAGVAQTTSPGITLTAVRIDSAKNTLALQGVAATRADLLQLQSNLEHSPLFGNVDIPLQDLSEKTNLAFSVAATLIPEAL